MKQEKIVCAAIKISWVGELSLEHSEVICGVDYSSIRNTGFYMNTKYRPENKKFESEKGFITNRNRFVDPREAMSIAIKAKQISYLNDLFEKYTNAVIGSRGVCDEAKMIFRAWDHQRKIIECRDLKPEDLY